MFLRSLFLVAAIFASFTTNAYSATITGSSYGTISMGYDGLGLFGDTGADLTGKNYSLTLSNYFSLENIYNDDSISLSITGNQGTSALNLVVGSAGLDTYADNMYNLMRLMNGASLGSSYYDYESLDFYSSGGSNSDFSSINVSQNVSNYTPIVGAVRDFNGAYARTITDTDSASMIISFYSGDEYTWFRSTPEFISVAGTTSVPEPTTFALLALGLLGFAARRRKQ